MAPLPDAPGEPASADATVRYPDAVLVPAEDQNAPAHLASKTQAESGGVYTLDGEVVIQYSGRELETDHATYDSNTGEVTLSGHVVLTETENDVRIEASHGSFNLHTETGEFYDVTGSMGMRRKPVPTATLTDQQQQRRYTNENPFLFTGMKVVKTGPRNYRIYNGTVTSCQLPRPDWLLSAGEFGMDDTKAHASKSVFHLMGVPFFWLPYVTHPVNADERETGILIPDVGINSASKGDTVGEQIYWAINRSTDLTVGTIYYSARGWEQTASFRWRGLGQDFAKAHYSGLQDRGYYPGGVYVNQSGTDVLFSGRHDLHSEDDAAAAADAEPVVRPVQSRMVADVEYLSSFPYREAFSTNFNQAVSSDVISQVFATRDWDGMAATFEGDRYQGEKRVANTTITPPQTEQQVHIFHAPALEFTTADHRLGSTGLEWNMESSGTGLKRTQPNFETSGMVERLDLHPELAYPLGFGGLRVRPSIAGRETFYSRSRLSTLAVPAPGLPAAPVESTATVNRADLELGVDIRPPVLERTFTSGWLPHLLRHEVKHTIEPEFTYRYTDGIGDFSNILRFDTVDVVSDTNEFEYGVTQRLFLKRAAGAACRTAGEAADATEILGSAGQDSDSGDDPGEAAGHTDNAETVCGNREWISWRVAQKYFFDHSFGGAVTNGPRAVLATTLDFSGVSFLTRPRDLSPLISRMRVRTSEKLDIEWDFDYDFCAPLNGAAGIQNANGCQQKFTANNVYLDVHQGDVFGGVGYARLNAPGRSYVEGSLSSVAEFDQMRVLFGFGKPTKPGLSAGAYAGIDVDLGTVQYGALETSYNWNCCGVSIEYRKYELGTARNDNGYKFNFTLANIGSAGNLRHSDQVF